MNLTASNSFPRTLRRFQSQQVALAGGIALAVAAAIGLAKWEAVDSGSATSSGPAVQQPASSRQAAPQHYVYVVGSESQRDSIAEASRESAGLSGPGQVISVMLVRPDDRDSQQALSAMIGEHMAGYLTDTQIIDLR